MKTKEFIFLLVATLFFESCDQQNGIEGLWVVDKVEVGEQEMTPNARWMRFNADSTQQSGNGWLQHSFGTWSLNEKTGELTVKNVNGLDDPYGAFKVSVENDTMFWGRQEEGQQVEIRLVRADSLPATFGNKLLGLWQLEQASGEGFFFEPTRPAAASNNYIFFRWDGLFVIGSEKGRFTGVYNVNGHKAELEMIPYGEGETRSFWKIEFNENRIKLHLLNNDNSIVRDFVRVHKFPE